MYTDIEGRTILERSWLEKDGVVQMLDTYYVYDDLGKLRYVLPPGLSEKLTGSISLQETDSLATSYAYSIVMMASVAASTKSFPDVLL